ncbi:MAG: ATPase of the class-like protein, partial [Clostridia bacterium]|nr:ATPase of the class-like protein [Clostridia bacterium]
MKRLKNILLSLLPNNTTYKEMYEGFMIVHDPNYPTMLPVEAYEATYWREDIRYDIEHTHKLAQDKPTITIGIPAAMLNIDSFCTAAADFCLRAFKPYIDELNDLNRNSSRPDKENGKYYLYAPNGEVLIRNSSYFKVMNQKYYTNKKGNAVSVLPQDSSRPPIMYLCISMQVQLPYKKHRKTIQMLIKDLPDAVDNFILNFYKSSLKNTLLLDEKQIAIRKWLKQSEYCAFIANGSILPRLAGTDLPLPGALPFKSTAGDEIEIFGVKGMGIKKGVTVITGGGYSGKSTLLDAISTGIYNHIEGDGRELVITDENAMKISAEDGRSVKNVNISPFIKWLPKGDTSNFSTEHASGSTSQATNIMEAISFGSKLLLIDEDKSATNFMIRDRLMKELIEKEPITPFTDRVNELYEKNGVSTILVIGGSGEYLSVADKIYMMQDFLISDLTEHAKSICFNGGMVSERPQTVDWKYNKTLLSEGFSSYPKDSGTEVLQVSDMGFIFIGDERI